MGCITVDRVDPSDFVKLVQLTRMNIIVSARLGIKTANKGISNYGAV